CQPVRCSLVDFCTLFVFRPFGERLWFADRIGPGPNIFSFEAAIRYILTKEYDPENVKNIPVFLVLTKFIGVGTRTEIALVELYVFRNLGNVILFFNKRYL